MCNNIFKVAHKKINNNIKRKKKLNKKIFKLTFYNYRCFSRQIKTCV